MSHRRALLAAAGGGASFAPPPPSPDPALATWEAAIAALPTGITYTLLGTSITEGVGASSGESWAEEFQDALVAAYGSHFTQTNHGHSNSKVADFLSGGGYRSDVTGIAAGEDLVVIETGVNDCFVGLAVSTFQSRLETLIGDVQGVTSASVVVLGMYEIDSLSAAQWDPYLAAMSDAAANTGAAFVSVAPSFPGGTAGSFAAPGSSVVKQGFTVNDYSGDFDLATGDVVYATVTTALSSAGLGVIAGTGTYNSSSGNGLGKHVFPAAVSAQLGCVLYAFPYSAGYTGGGTFRYGPGLLADGVHPNDLGHQVIADVVYAFLT